MFFGFAAQSIDRQRALASQAGASVQRETIGRQVARFTPVCHNTRERQTRQPPHRHRLQHQHCPSPCPAPAPSFAADDDDADADAAAAAAADADDPGPWSPPLSCRHRPSFR